MNDLVIFRYFIAFYTEGICIKLEINMVEIANTPETLTQLIHALGYSSIIDFAREQAKCIIQQKIAYYKSRIDFFEQKYGLNFDVFCQNFEQIKRHSIFEKEDDSIAWETSIDVVVAYQKDLLALNQ